MTTDTSRPAVEALIAEAQPYSKYPDFCLFGCPSEPHEHAKRIETRLSDTLQALLDERDGLENSLSARDVELQQDALRIRDLEATVDNLRLISNANGDWNIKYQEVNHRAERAEAERDVYKRAKAENDERFQIEAAEQRERADRLAAKLDAVKALDDFAGVFRAAWLRADGEGRQGERVRSGLRAVSAAILADTDEGKDSITFNTDDLGPATDIDGNPLADTNEPRDPESFADRMLRQSDDAAEAKWGVRPNGTEPKGDEQ